MPYNAYVPYSVDPESLRAGHPTAIRTAVANLAYAGARAGAQGLKRKFISLAMSQGDNVAIAALSAASSVGAGEVAKIARTVASDVGGIPVLTGHPGRTRTLFGRLGRGLGRGRTRIRGTRFKRRAARRYSSKRRVTYRRAPRRRSRYGRRRYY